MDVVERVGVDPWIFGIIDLEVEIWRHVIRLHGGEIGADYTGRGKLFGKFYSPDSCPSGDIEDVVETAFEGLEGC
jgi:hypothetical protein